jgi:nuclear cap-binding protein subunit 1
LEISEGNIDTTVRNIAMQSLLHIGSRSFSHFLNAIERYLPLLRNLASGGVSSTGGGGNPEAKFDILAAAAAFWKHNRHMVGIVFDKLMQYQIVDPSDVVAWTFANAQRQAFGAFEWDLLKGALDKANGRVVVARRRVQALRKEEDDTRAKAKAGGADNSMEVDVDTREGTLSCIHCVSHLSFSQVFWLFTQKISPPPIIPPSLRR